MPARKLLTLIALYILVQPVFAVEIFECEDANGNVSFQDRCPPGTRPVNQRNYSTTTSADTTTNPGRLTLYMIPNCDTCDQVKEFLRIRNLDFSEVDVSTDLELQNELKSLAGELQVPVLLVGQEVLSGYNRSALIQTLTSSGHITQQE